MVFFSSQNFLPLYSLRSQGDKKENSSETYTFVNFFFLLEIFFVIVSVLNFDVRNQEILEGVGPGTKIKMYIEGLKINCSGGSNTPNRTTFKI